MFTHVKSEEQSANDSLNVEIIEIDMETLCGVAGGDGTKSPFIGGT
jgi:hypothetical protein